MPVDALLLALAAAFVHAAWNLLLSGSEDTPSATAVALAAGGNGVRPGAGAPPCPGIVTAINRVPANADSAITSAYERALHIPPGSSSTVCSAPPGPDSTTSHSVSTRAGYGTHSTPS